MLLVISNSKYLLTYCKGCNNKTKCRRGKKLMILCPKMCIQIIILTSSQLDPELGMRKMKSPQRRAINMIKTKITEAVQTIHLYHYLYYQIDPKIDKKIITADQEVICLNTCHGSLIVFSHKPSNKFCILYLAIEVNKFIQRNPSPFRYKSCCTFRCGYF